MAPDNLDKRAPGCLATNLGSWGDSLVSFVFGECGTPRPGKGSVHTDTFQCENADSPAADVARKWLQCRFRSSDTAGALALITDTFLVSSPTGKWGPDKDEVRACPPPHREVLERRGASAVRLLLIVRCPCCPLGPAACPAPCLTHCNGTRPALSRAPAASLMEWHQGRDAKRSRCASVYDGARARPEMAGQARHCDRDVTISECLGEHGVGGGEAGRHVAARLFHLVAGKPASQILTALLSSWAWREGTAFDVVATSGRSWRQQELSCCATVPRVATRVYSSRVSIPRLSPTQKAAPVRWQGPSREWMARGLALLTPTRMLLPGWLGRALCVLTLSRRDSCVCVLLGSPCDTPCSLSRVGRESPPARGGA